MSKRPDPLHYELLVKRLLRTRLAHDTGHTPHTFHRKHYQGASGQDNTHSTTLICESDRIRWLRSLMAVLLWCLG